MEDQDAEYDSVADLCVAIPREDEVCYIMDDETPGGRLHSHYRL